MKKTKQKRKTGLLGLIEEIETKWAYHYCNEGAGRIDGKETEPEYRWVVSKKLAARLRRIYRNEIAPLRRALAQALDTTSFFGCPGRHCEHYADCESRKKADKARDETGTHCFRHEEWRKLLGVPNEYDGKGRNG